MTAQRTDPAFQETASWLEAQGYGYPLPMPGDRYIALLARPFNVRLVLGHVDDRTGLIDGWCYTGPTEAVIGLVQWFEHPEQPEPTGWFRHPTTGRRVARTDGEIDEHGRVVPLGEVYVRP